MLGRYRVVRRLAQGGMGEVFLGHDTGLDRPVAIKRLRPGGGLGVTRRQRFRREARLAAGLDHPAIVRVYDLFEDGGLECLVMEYVEGTTLRRLLRDGPLPLSVMLELAVIIAEGIQEAHEHGIVHRDLKTENILVDPDAGPKISDFGVAKRYLREGDESPISDLHGLIGTCRVMSPEQAMGEALDHRSDLFSFGVMLYEMSSGVSPFEDRNNLLTLKRLACDPHRPLRELVPDVSLRLTRLVDHLLEKTPDARPATTAEVVQRLYELRDDASGSGVLRLRRLLEPLGALLGRRRDDESTAGGDGPSD